MSDTDNAPVEGALVTLLDVTSGTRRVIGAGPTGSFSFELLEPGLYELFAEQVGYRPVRVRVVRVSPGRRVRVDIVLRADSLPVAAIDTVRSGGGAGAVAPGDGAFLSPFAIGRLPAEGRGVAGLLSLVTADPGDETTRLGDAVQGLPVLDGGLAVSGITYRVPRAPDLPRSWEGSAAVPRSAAAEAELLEAPPDVEWADVASGRLAVTPRRGTEAARVSAFGDVTGAGLSSSRLFDAGGLPRTSWHAGLVASGPVIRDTAQFAVGIEAERLEQPVARPWIATATDSALQAIASSRTVDLASYLAPRTVRLNWTSGFGRFDWRLGARSAVNIWVAGGTFDRSEPVTGPMNAVSVGAPVKGTDVVAGATVASVLGEGAYNELRAGFELGQREFATAAVPATFFADGPSIGGDPGLGGTFQQTALHLRDVLHLPTGKQDVKLGLALRLASYSNTYEFGRGGVYYTDVTSLAADRGVYFVTQGPPAAATFSVPALGAFLQDQWSVGKGLMLTFGGRFDLDLLPSSKTPANADWLAKTGIASATLPRKVGRWSSLISFDWTPDDNAVWLVHTGAGVYSGGPDPSVVSELVTETGKNTLRRVVGAIGTWPTAPDPAQAPSVGALLTILGPKYQLPRSTKAAFGISRGLGGGGALDVAVNYRHTDFLLRRHDLNRPLGPVATDQYGRPIYGQLVQERSVLAEASGTGRRFDGFDLVSALDPDGYSDYWGVTASLDHPLGRFLRLLARYAYSQTKDNVLTGLYGGPYAQLTPFPDSLQGADWADGTSDFDVPHRVVVGFELAPLGRPGFTVAGRYRFQAGRPFTPGFRAGVDANGDGSFTNDPAFVDDTLSGMADLIARYPCLAAQARQFAARNSCRDPGIATFDLRVGMGPASLGGNDVEVWLEALNLFDPYVAVRDHALYLVDGARSLMTDPASARTTVPLLVNPGFGEAMGLRTPGRTVRIGLRVNY